VTVRDTLRVSVGVLGEVVMTAGVIVILFVVWQLGFEGVVQGNAQAVAVSGLEQRFDGGHPRPTGTNQANPTPPVDGGGSTAVAAEPRPTAGQAFAILRIPRLGGPTWSKPVLEGTGLDVLAQGVGHYTSTSMPGQIGNVALAGHRAGHGNPLIDIDSIREGDVMVLETQGAYYVYRVTGHEIVPPTHVQVLDPVPDQPGVAATTSQLTLTSCDPRYGSTNRYIVFSRLEQTVPRAQGLPAGLLDDPAGA
jgi:sortase A